MAWFFSARFSTSFTRNSFNLAVCRSVGREPSASLSQLWAEWLRTKTRGLKKVNEAKSCNKLCKEHWAADLGLRKQSKEYISIIIFMNMKTTLKTDNNKFTYMTLALSWMRIVVLYLNVDSEIKVHRLCFCLFCQCFTLGQSTRRQAKQNSGLPRGGKLFCQTIYMSTGGTIRLFIVLPQYCTTHWQLVGAPALQIAAVKISLPFGHIPLLHVSIFFLPPVGKTSQITLLMNRADIIPVIAGRCILLP